VARDFRAIRAAYRGLPEADVPEAVAERVRAAARGELAGQRDPARRIVGRRAPRRRAVLALAAAVVAALGLWFLLEDGGIAERTPDERIADQVRLGEAHRERGEPARAAAAFEEALRLAGDGPRAAELLLRLAELHLEGEQPARALERLDRLAAAHPEHGEGSDALLLRGEALEALGELEPALEAYRRVARDFPASGAEAERRVRDLEALRAAQFPDELRALGYVE